MYAQARGSSVPLPQLALTVSIRGRRVGPPNTTKVHHDQRRITCCQRATRSPSPQRASPACARSTQRLWPSHHGRNRRVLDRPSARRKGPLCRPAAGHGLAAPVEARDLELGNRTRRQVRDHRRRLEGPRNDRRSRLARLRRPVDRQSSIIATAARLIPVEGVRTTVDPVMLNQRRAEQHPASRFLLVGDVHPQGCTRGRRTVVGHTREARLAVAVGVDAVGIAVLGVRRTVPSAVCDGPLSEPPHQSQVSPR